MRRIIVGGCIVIAAAFLPTQPVAAHGGSEADLTSDYRTRITEVPHIDGLEARTVGLDGTIKLSWTGTGTLVVAGYQGEPYLRFDDTGVAVNMRSPAAHLNQDRYANSEVPADADPNAEPDWQPATTTTNLACALFDYQHEILAFTRNLDIPFDNNQAERDLRMAKPHQKNSGGWRTPQGIKDFATIRSYLETGRKHGQNPYTALVQLHTTGPWPLPT